MDGIFNTRAFCLFLANKQTKTNLQGIHPFCSFFWLEMFLLALVRFFDELKLKTTKCCVENPKLTCRRRIRDK